MNNTHERRVSNAPAIAVVVVGLAGAAWLVNKLVESQNTRARLEYEARTLSEDYNSDISVVQYQQLLDGHPLLLRLDGERVIVRLGTDSIGDAVLVEADGTYVPRVLDLEQ